MRVIAYMITQSKVTWGQLDEKFCDFSKSKKKPTNRTKQIEQTSMVCTPLDHSDDVLKFSEL